MDQYHVGISAEAFAAAFFAQGGCEVLVQYGANQPEYDLVVSRGAVLRKISVKGSKDGGWPLVVGFKDPTRTYHQAIEAWSASHRDQDLVYCLVQFKKVDLGSPPRIYLASISEIAAYLKSSHCGEGYTSLREHHEWKRGSAAGTTDSIPLDWKFSVERLNRFMPVVAGDA